MHDLCRQHLPGVHPRRLRATKVTDSLWVSEDVRGRKRVNIFSCNIHFERVLVVDV